MRSINDWPNEPTMMTDRELFRRFGYLSPGRQEAMIDRLEQLDSANINTGAIDEAAAMYPDEGFLEELAEDIFEIADRYLSDAALKEFDKEVSAKIDTIQKEYAGNTEYGKKLLRDFATALERGGIE